MFLNLHHISEEFAVDIVKKLLVDDTSPDRLNTILSDFIASDIHPKAVKSILEDDRFQNPTAIKWASKHGYTNIVESLFRSPKLYPDDLNFALILACEFGHIDIVKLLLKNNLTDPRFSNNQALIIAAQKEHMDIAKLLIPKINLSTITNSVTLNFLEKIKKSEDDTTKELSTTLHNTTQDYIIIQLSSISNIVCNDKTITVTYNK